MMPLVFPPFLIDVYDCCICEHEPPGIIIIISVIVPHLSTEGQNISLQVFGDRINIICY